jgi:hypothetical protein
MRNSRKKKKDFREMLEKYLEIKGLDIVVVLEDGQEVELYKNRSIVDDVIITLENGKAELRIPLSSIKTVDLFAA